MLSYCTNYLATMPDIVVYMNCDTRLAINLNMLDLGENDEFIFAIKNYSYADSSCVFLFRSRLSEADENGEVIFKIPPEASKSLRQGAFYNFSVLLNAFDPRQETEYKKLTDNGRVILEYGAHDLALKPEISKPSNAIDSEILDLRLELIDEVTSIRQEITNVRLELLDEVSTINPTIFMGEILDVHLESLDSI